MNGGIIFRHQRGGLAESMETARVVGGFGELCEYIVEDVNKWGLAGRKVSREDLVFRFYCDKDERVGWNDILIVILKGTDVQVPYVLGFASTNWECGVYEKWLKEEFK